MGTIGQYTISREQLNIPGVNVYLSDKLENKTICLNDIKSYSFSYTGGDDRKRFSLIFKSQQTDNKNAIMDQSLSTINIYPNPSKGKFFITGSNPIKIKQVDVFDSRGNHVKTLKDIISQPIEVDLTGQAKGAYLIIISDDKVSKEFKVIIE